MKVEVEALDQVRRKVGVVVPEEQIDRLREGIYDELRTQSKIKGFRPGKVPRSILTTYYKDYIEDELKKRMIQSTMAEALTTSKVDPVVEPVADFIEENGRHGYTLECEVLPDVEPPSYKGIEVEVDRIVVDEGEIDKRIEGLQQMHAEMITREGDGGAQKDDFVVIKYQGYLNGKPLKDVGTESYPLELGGTTVLPEFEAVLYGMKVGDEREVEVSFPADYPDKDIASRRVLFRILLKEIKEKRIPTVNDDFAKDLSFENVTAMRDGLRKEIEKEKDTARQREVSQKIMDSLLKDIEIPVPRKLLENRISAMVSDAMLRFRTDRMTDEEKSKMAASLRKEAEPRAEERIKVEILLSKIVEREGIKVEEQEVLERLKRIAGESRRPFSEIESFYTKNNLLDTLRSSMAEERAVSLLRDAAVIKEKA
jgi:trigger factor